MKTKNQILSVRIETVGDDDPDLSYLGEFTNDPSPEAFIRYGEHSGKQVKDLGEDDSLPEKGREYRFFLPGMTAEQTGNPESPKQDWRRMEDYGNGWSMVGIIAKAVIQTESGISQTLRSGGIWGVESDISKEYVAELEKEELSALHRELENLGFKPRAIRYAFRNLSRNT